jgi:hypothetical protein
MKLFGLFVLAWVLASIDAGTCKPEYSWFGGRSDEAWAQQKCHEHNDDKTACEATSLSSGGSECAGCRCEYTDEETIQSATNMPLWQLGAIIFAVGLVLLYGL